MLGYITKQKPAPRAIAFLLAALIGLSAPITTSQTAFADDDVVNNFLSLTGIETIKSDKAILGEDFNILEIVPTQNTGSIGYYVDGQEPFANWQDELAGKTQAERAAYADSIITYLNEAGIIDDDDDYADAPLTEREYKEYYAWEKNIPDDALQVTLGTYEEVTLNGEFEPTETGEYGYFDEDITTTIVSSGSHYQIIDYLVAGEKPSQLDDDNVYHYDPTFAQIANDVAAEALEDHTPVYTEASGVYVYAGYIGQPGFTLDFTVEDDGGTPEDATDDTYVVNYYYVSTFGEPSESYSAGDYYSMHDGFSVTATDGRATDSKHFDVDLNGYDFMPAGNGDFNFEEDSTKPAEKLRYNTIFVQTPVQNNDWFYRYVLDVHDPSTDPGFDITVNSKLPGDVLAADVANADLIVFSAGYDLATNKSLVTSYKATNATDITIAVKDDMLEHLTGDEKKPFVIDSSLYTNTQSNMAYFINQALTSVSIFNINPADITKLPNGGVASTVYIYSGVPDDDDEDEDDSEFAHLITTEFAEKFEDELYKVRGSAYYDVYEQIVSENEVRKLTGSSTLLPTEVNIGNSIRHIINFADRLIINNKTAINVLEIQPMVPVSNTLVKNQAELTPEIVSGWLDGLVTPENISIATMSISEYIGKIDDINEVYDLVYIGSSVDGMNTIEIDGEIVPNYNDDTMDGMLYTNIGDIYYLEGSSTVAIPGGHLNSDYIENLLVDVTNVGEVNPLKLINKTSKDVNDGAYISRFTGYDLTPPKLNEIVDFAESGYPVIISNTLIEQENTKSEIHIEYDQVGDVVEMVLTQPTAAMLDAHQTMSVQWYKDGSAISGATNIVYSTSEEGVYYCEVSVTANGQVNKGDSSTLTLRTGQISATDSLVGTRPVTLHKDDIRNDSGIYYPITNTLVNNDEDNDKKYDIGETFEATANINFVNADGSKIVETADWHLALSSGGVSYVLDESNDDSNVGNELLMPAAGADRDYQIDGNVFTGKNFIYSGNFLYNLATEITVGGNSFYSARVYIDTGFGSDGTDYGIKHPTNWYVHKNTGNGATSTVNGYKSFGFGGTLDNAITSTYKLEVDTTSDYDAFDGSFSITATPEVTDFPDEFMPIYTFRWYDESKALLHTETDVTHSTLERTAVAIGDKYSCVISDGDDIVYEIVYFEANNEIVVTEDTDNVGTIELNAQAPTATEYELEVGVKKSVESVELTLTNPTIADVYPNSMSVQWYKDGVAVPNATATSFLTKESGDYYCMVTFYLGSSSQTKKSPVTRVEMDLENLTMREEESGVLPVATPATTSGELAGYYFPITQTYGVIDEDNNKIASVGEQIYADVHTNFVEEVTAYDWYYNMRSDLLSKKLLDGETTSAESSFLNKGEDGRIYATARNNATATNSVTNIVDLVAAVTAGGETFYSDHSYVAAGYNNWYWINRSSGWFVNRPSGVPTNWGQFTVKGELTGKSTSAYLMNTTYSETILADKTRKIEVGTVVEDFPLTPKLTFSWYNYGSTKILEEEDVVTSTVSITPNIGQTLTCVISDGNGFLFDVVYFRYYPDIVVTENVDGKGGESITITGNTVETMEIDQFSVDNSSYMFEALETIKDHENVMSVRTAEMNTATLIKYLNLSKPSIVFTTDDDGNENKPQEYTGDYSTNLLNGSNIEFKFEIENPTDPTPEDTLYEVNLYIDTNADGRHNGMDENVPDIQISSENGAVKNGELKVGTEYTVTRVLPEIYVGAIPWSLEIIDVANDAAHNSVQGITYLKPSKPVEIHALQIVHTNNAYNPIAYQSNTDLSEGRYITGDDGYDEYEALFNSLYKAGVYDIKIDFMTIAQVNALTTEQNKLDKFNEYDMLILGFYDSYGSSVSFTDYNEDGTKYTGTGLSVESSNAIISFIDSGKATLFTHDNLSTSALPMTSFPIENGSGVSVVASTSGSIKNLMLRDYAGVDRYAVTNTEYGLATATEQVFNSLYLDDESQIDSSNIVSNAYNYENGATMTDKDRDALIEAGYSIAYKPGSNRTEYVNETQGISDYMFVPIGNEYVDQLGFNELVKIDNNYAQSTTSITQVNKGQITTFPYNLNLDGYGGDETTLTVKNTHGQYLQLNMNPEEIVVWYTLASKSVHDIYSYTYNNTINNYYIYNNGNVTYTGSGHSYGQVTPLEAQLFVNTIVAAYRVGKVDPTVDFSNNLTDFFVPTELQEVDGSVSSEAEYSEDNLEAGENSASRAISFSFNEPNLTLGKDVSLTFHSDGKGALDTDEELTFYADVNITNDGYAVVPLFTDGELETNLQVYDKDGDKVTGELRSDITYTVYLPDALFDEINSTTGEAAQIGIPLRLEVTTKFSDGQVVGSSSFITLRKLGLLPLG